jgi:hypothetical protein
MINYQKYYTAGISNLTMDYDPKLPVYFPVCGFAGLSYQPYALTGLGGRAKPFFSRLRYVIQMFISHVENALASLS